MAKHVKNRQRSRMGRGKILKEIGKKIEGLIESLLPRPQPHLAPVPVRHRKNRR